MNGQSQHYSPPIQFSQSNNLVPQSPPPSYDEHQHYPATFDQPPQVVADLPIIQREPEQVVVEQPSG